MKKKILIITLIIILFTILISTFFMYFKNKPNKNSDNITQTETVSINQTLETDYINTTNSVSTSTTIIKKTRTQEIQNRINTYGKQEKGIPVLMYHFFYDNSAGKTDTDNNFIEISKFEQHLKYLTENDFFFPTFKELLQFINGEIELPKKSVILTVDDGDVSFFNLAAPLIEQYEIPVTSFAITSQCGLIYESNYINFESHSHNLHKAGKNGKGLLVNLPYEKASQDIQQSINILHSKEAFCYPFGHYNDTAKQVLKDIGYKVAFTTKGGRVKSGMDPLELPRIRILRDDSLSSFITKVN